jgi:hypothetical protein
MTQTSHHPPAQFDDVDVIPTEGVMMTDTYVEIGGVNLRCLCESVALVPDLNPITVTTFCGVQDYPGPVKWHLTATFVQSFGDGGTDAALSEALDNYLATGTTCPFKVRPFSARPVSPTNPEYSGELIPDFYQPFGGDAGAASEVEIDWSMTGRPAKDTGAAGPPAATGATAGSPGNFQPAGANPPANLAAMAGIVASPASAWDADEYVVLGDASTATWSGTGWVVWTAP